jgi:hypothetical protein
VILFDKEEVMGGPYCVDRDRGIKLVVDTASGVEWLVVEDSDGHQYGLKREGHNCTDPKLYGVKVFGDREAEWRCRYFFAEQVEGMYERYRAILQESGEGGLINACYNWNGVDGEPDTFNMRGDVSSMSGSSTATITCETNEGTRGSGKECVSFNIEELEEGAIVNGSIRRISFSLDMVLNVTYGVYGGNNRSSGVQHLIFSRGEMPFESDGTRVLFEIGDSAIPDLEGGMRQHLPDSFDDSNRPLVIQIISSADDLPEGCDYGVACCEGYDLAWDYLGTAIAAYVANEIEPDPEIRCYEMPEEEGCDCSVASSGVGLPAFLGLVFGVPRR